MHKFNTLFRMGLVSLNQPAGGEGGGGDAAAADDAAAAAALSGAAAPAPKPGPPAGGAPAAQAAAGTEDEAKAWIAEDGKTVLVDKLPEPLRNMISGLRNEAAEKRTKAAEAVREQKAAIVTLAKELGIELPEGADGTPTVEDLTGKLNGTAAELTQSKVELAVFRTAAQHGGNPAALTDSRAFLAKVQNLDPAADDFTAKIVDAAKAAVAENASLKAAPVAGASGVDHPGGTGEGKQQPASLTAAVDAAYATTQ